jgi:hypothetical protein
MTDEGWEVVQRPSEGNPYADFERTCAKFHDEGETDLVQRISFDTEKRTAWTVITRTNDDGDTRELASFALYWDDATRTLLAQGSMAVQMVVRELGAGA